MKTLLSLLFGVIVGCLLPSIGMAADAARPAKGAAVKAVSGFALTTHRPGEFRGHTTYL